MHDGDDNYDTVRLPGFDADGDGCESRLWSMCAGMSDQLGYCYCGVLGWIVRRAGDGMSAFVSRMGH